MVAKLRCQVFCSSLLCPFIHPAVRNVSGVGAGFPGWSEPCATQTCSGCTKRNSHWLRGSLGPRCSKGTIESWLPCRDRGCVLIVPVLVCSCLASSHYSRLELSQAQRQSAAESSVGFPLRDVGSLESVQGKHCSGLNWGCFRLHSSELISQRQRHYSPIRNVSVFFLMRTKHFIPVH